jgi:hypothetical protein
MLSAPLLHGAVGILDELVLVTCIVVVAAIVFSFYISELRKSKEDK